MKIGFIGIGVVGGAIFKAFSRSFEVVGYDKFVPEFKKNKELILQTSFLFLSLPSPTSKESRGYTQGLAPILETLEYLSNHNYPNPVVLKSTVLPGTTNKLKSWFPKLRLVHNPEFLTAASPYEDFMCSPVVHLGGALQDIEAPLSAYKVLLPATHMLSYEDPSTTELIKYMHNVGLALKVGFSNMIFEVSQKMGVDYEMVRTGTVMIGGIGSGHTQVPGPDGERGYSGMCLPKDTKAFLSFMQTRGMDAGILQALDEYNEQIRPSEINIPIKIPKIC